MRKMIARIFKRKPAEVVVPLPPPPTAPIADLRTAVERAAMEQLAFEASHPVAYALDQRVTAIVQRAARATKVDEKVIRSIVESMSLGGQP